MWRARLANPSIMLPLATNTAGSGKIKRISESIPGMLSRDIYGMSNRHWSWPRARVGAQNAGTAWFPGPSVILAPNTETTENTAPIKRDDIEIPTKIDINLVTA